MARILNLKTGLLFLVFLVILLTFLGSKKAASPDGSNEVFRINKKKVGNDAETAVYDFHEDIAAEPNQLDAKKPGSIVSQKQIRISYNEEETGDNLDFDEETLQNFEGDKDVEKKTAVKSKSIIKKLDDLKSAGGRVTKRRDLSDITCEINRGKFIVNNCKKDDNEVYIPFSFLRKYYEVSGKMSDKDPSKFIWQNSNQYKLYRPKNPYNPAGVFMFFENYNVEVRERVKCVSGTDGIPVSTQWNRNGYLYPIQIAQFALSHFSRYAKGEKTERVVLEDADTVLGYWIGSISISRTSDPLNLRNNVLQLQYSTDDAYEPVSLELKRVGPRYLTLSLALMTDVSASIPVADAGNVNITFTIAATYDQTPYNLHYVTQNFLIKTEGTNIYHGIGLGSLRSWQYLIRDLWVDFQKGIQQVKRKPKLVRSKFTIQSFSVNVPKKIIRGGENAIESSTISFEPVILIDNLTLSTNAHLPQFFQAADWLLSAQDSSGGWPIPVARKFGPSFHPVLNPGWYSAMAQGHALSVLARAYNLTGNAQYATACSKAVSSIFDEAGPRDGVKAIFMDKYVWYEEYPTQPSTFVLNGFMYSLLGLYDTFKLNIPGATSKASKLYTDGIKSLTAMLPLYDTGWGSMYDLKHFSVKGIAPNPARLDYHVTHVNQLLVLSTIETDSLFKDTAERWIGYLEGERAPHN